MRESARRPTAARRRLLRPRTRREPGRTSRWRAARPPRSRGARAIAAAGFRRSWSRRPDADHTIEAGRGIALAVHGALAIILVHLSSERAACLYSRSAAGSNG